MEEKKDTTATEFIQVIQPDQHAKLAFTGCNGCTMCCDGSTYMRAAVLLDEMFDTAKLFPVVFMKEKEDLGLHLIYTLGKNVPCPYLDTRAKRCSVYNSVRPRACKTYPFNIKEITSSTDEDGRETLNYAVIFDSRCPGLKENQGGIPVIDPETGKISERIIKGFIGESNLRRYRQNLLNTRHFLQTIKELDVVVEEKLVVGISPPGSGCSSGADIMSVNLNKISEEKLAALGSEAVMKLHSYHYFNAIYTHLNSISNLKQLAETRNVCEQSPVDLVTFRMWQGQP